MLHPSFFVFACPVVLWLFFGTVAYAMENPNNPAQPVIPGPNLEPAGPPIPQPAAGPTNQGNNNPGRVARDECIRAAIRYLVKGFRRFILGEDEGEE